MTLAHQSTLPGRWTPSGRCKCVPILLDCVTNNLLNVREAGRLKCPLQKKRVEPPESSATRELPPTPAAVQHETTTQQDNEVASASGRDTQNLPACMANKPGLPRLKTTFCDAVRGLESIGMPYMLAYGTALGVRRDGELIAWDDDVDFAVFHEDLWRKGLLSHDTINMAMAAHGFRVQLSP
jgi:hypothetical protein